MKRVVWVISILLVLGIALICSYQKNPEFKASFDSWLGVLKHDSIEHRVNADPVTKVIRHKKKQKPRARIPKKIRPDKFYKLDEFAKNTPERYSYDKLELAEYLSTLGKNDLEKARLLYTWISTHIRYDDEAYNTEIYKDGSADSVLVRRTAVCDGYGSLFLELGLLMDLEVVKIFGYAKGYGFTPGDKFSATNHAWNAVRIDERWQLIDVTWGSSYGITRNNKLQTIMRFNPYWFCVDPEEFIFSHFPENKDLQLTKTQIDISQFEALPDVDRSIFELGFDGEEVFHAALSGSVKEFVETHAVDFPIKKVALPMTAVVDRGREYEFILHSEYAEEIVIIDAGEWIYLKKEGDRFSVKYIPLNDGFEIAVKLNWFDVLYSTIVAYNVRIEDNLTEQSTAYNQWQTQ